MAGVAGALGIDNAGLGAGAGLEFSLVGLTRPSAEFVRIGFVLFEVVAAGAVTGAAAVGAVVVVAKAPTTPPAAKLIG